MLLQSVLDPGHGPLSSVDEQTVAVAAFVVFALVGLLAEYAWRSKGLAVVGALVGYVLTVVLWAPPLFAEEWHYAILAAVPIVVLNYLYEGRSKKGA